MLKIIVGSKNQVKVSAIREVISNYAFLSNAEVIGVSTSSDVSKQPLSLEETIQGAKNRAENAYQPHTLSVGLEGGIMEIPTSDNEFMQISICSIFDGEKHHLGMSSGFRLPKSITTSIIEEGLDLVQALIRGKLTDNPELGASEGVIGLLTKGRIDRKSYCKQSFTNALVSIEQSHYFEVS
ncbi:MAG: inosine/xanthosine triphosphatase [Chlamydiota bacterium]|nr:inosine/xanthosine triphosphatase [Chlamydiota bacterium]